MGAQTKGRAFDSDCAAREPGLEVLRRSVRLASRRRFRCSLARAGTILYRPSRAAQTGGGPTSGVRMDDECRGAFHRRPCRRVSQREPSPCIGRMHGSSAGLAGTCIGSGTRSRARQTRAVEGGATGQHHQPSLRPWQRCRTHGARGSPSRNPAQEHHACHAVPCACSKSEVFPRLKWFPPCLLSNTLLSWSCSAIAGVVAAPTLVCNDAELRGEGREIRWQAAPLSACAYKVAGEGSAVVLSLLLRPLPCIPTSPSCPCLPLWLLSLRRCVRTPSTILPSALHGGRATTTPPASRRRRSLRCRRPGSTHSTQRRVPGASPTCPPRLSSKTAPSPTPPTPPRPRRSATGR